ncbi:hypothetical protein Taro_045213 [Colocasia esculenta]|uniref:TF-B3 domain-containing protein n=1 Tax=Colocasia esculenta TaxID=4460 RepID=A0A843WWH4_COLES|nr:hypothetical protein [Colocasia esculenta]
MSTSFFSRYRKEEDTFLNVLLTLSLQVSDSLAMEEAYECMTSNQVSGAVRMRESSDSDDAASSLQPPAKRCRLEPHSSFPSRFFKGVADLQREGRRRTQTYGHHAAAASSADEVPGSHEGVVSQELFRKELTPSDVGKLNRLVIPKKQAERHFPRIQAPGWGGGGGPRGSGDGSVEGMMLEFKDAEGRSWEFRYCYWRSSQSFVFTKGWNRFIRTRGLREGDVVAFYRCECKYGRRKPFCMIDVMHGAGGVRDDSDELVSAIGGGGRGGEDGEVALDDGLGGGRKMFSAYAATDQHVRTRDYWKEEGGEFVSEPERVCPGKKSFMLFGVQITSA